MIRRDSKVPIYHQLYKMLRERIIRKEWRPGDMLPTENDLIEKHGVSRSTVRQALDQLVGEDLIYRERGRGTFVAHPSIEQTLTRIISFTEDMQRRGMEPHTEVLSSSVIPAPEDIAKRLKIEPGEELARLERLRLADGDPMSIEESYLVHRYCEGVLDDDYSQKPLRQALEKQYGIRLVQAKQTIRAVNAKPKIAEKLGIQVGGAVLMIERVSYSSDMVPVEFIRFHHRGDRYILYNELND